MSVNEPRPMRIDNINPQQEAETKSRAEAMGSKAFTAVWAILLDRMDAPLGVSMACYAPDAEQALVYTQHRLGTRFGARVVDMWPMAIFPGILSPISHKPPARDDLSQMQVKGSA